MALRIRKDIKKSSYYVWFLGAKESKGLRGKEYILPVIDHLVQREKDIEPFKVTLQISHKGLKIIQTILSTNPKTSKPKNEVIKHFIPHNTITCVYQDEDVVSAILLLFNPVTKCPLHVHVYRCDSVETATLLRSQLEVLIDRPENQKKFQEIESRFKAAREKKKFESSLGSDTGHSTRDSVSSNEDRYSPGENKMASLYDSLAAELRQKLGKNESPILLPPRDYDTVHRQKGNLNGIDMRRCLNTSIVGPNAKGRRLESSGGSSGIGSDHAPSPDSPDSPDRFNIMDNQSTSDEEWNAEPTDSSMYLMDQAPEMILPRPSRNSESSKFSPESPKSPDFRPEPRFSCYTEENYPKDRADKYEPVSDQEYYHRYESHKNESGRNESGRNDRNKDKYRTKYDEFEEVEYREKKSGKEKRISPKYDERYYEEEKYPDRRQRYEYYQSENKRTETTHEKPRKFAPDDPRFYTPSEKTRSDYYEERKYPEDNYFPEHIQMEKKKFNAEDPRYYTDSRQSERSMRSKYSHEESSRSKYAQEESPRKYQDDFFDDVPESRRRPEERQRSPTPDNCTSPRDRFRDAKEKFLLMEKERLDEQENLRRQELLALKDKTFLKRHESLANKHSYDERRYENEGRYMPKPAPRNIVREEEIRYRRQEPLDRYRSPDRYENRRSVASQIEEEHRRNSNEIAKELKRRSYMEHYDQKDYYREKYEMPDTKRYPGLERDQYSKSNVEIDKVADKHPKITKVKSAGYRHSYAEPKLAMEKKKYFPDILHRTNSTVSNSGRVGIASVTPY